MDPKTTTMKFILILISLNAALPLCLGQNGKWTIDAEACIRNHNDWSGEATSFGNCQQICENQTSFTCLSIDYMNGICKNSRFNRQSVRPIEDFTQPCYNGQPWHYSERLDIAYGWTDIVSGCIRNHNDWTGSVSDITACQKRCEVETSFLCLSIDYADGVCKLSRFNRDTVRPTEDYTQPCYGSGGWMYAERRDTQYFWTEAVMACTSRYKDWHGIASSLTDCQKKCEQERNFTCLSIEYTGGVCKLSRFNRNTIRPTSVYTQPCQVAGWNYAERILIGQWTPEIDACIRLHNKRTVTVPDLDSCRLICSQEDGCCSFDYRDGYCNLSDTNRKNVIPSSDYTEPCYSPGWQYSERVDRLCR